VAATEGGIQPYATDTEPTAPTALPPVTDSSDYGTPGFSGHSASPDPGDIRGLLSAIRERQDKEDLTHDMADLRRVIQAALQTDHDSAMIEILQISRDEIPGVIETLRRALERESRREQDVEAAIEGVEITSKKSMSLHSQAGSNMCPTSTLFSELLKSGIGALMGMGKGIGLSPPPWTTIMRWEIDCDGKIGTGFSNVYRGTWGGMAVAVRVLTPTAPRELFIREVEIWKSLSHPNVLKFLGASSFSGEPPFFLVSPYTKRGSLDKYLKSVDPQSQINLLKMIYEVGLGMEYLHEKKVLHGNLKVR